MSLKRSSHCFSVLHLAPFSSSASSISKIYPQSSLFCLLHYVPIHHHFLPASLFHFLPSYSSLLKSDHIPLLAENLLASASRCCIHGKTVSSRLMTRPQPLPSLTLSSPPLLVLLHSHDWLFLSSLSSPSMDLP